MLRLHRQKQTTATVTATASCHDLQPRSYFTILCIYSRTIYHVLLSQALIYVSIGTTVFFSPRWTMN
jgi:hypothetical protein